ncbi:MAG: hypothetical protein R3E63_02260 [Pseudomonadales bacterium]
MVFLDELTSQWLEDRQQMLSLSISGGSSDTSYIDFITWQKDNIIGAGDKQILFGAESSDTLTSSNANDHLYGAGGSDYLSGGAGNDYLEGGAGDDEIECRHRF